MTDELDIKYDDIRFHCTNKPFHVTQRRCYGVVKKAAYKLYGKGAFINMSMVYSWVSSDLTLREFLYEKVNRNG